MTTTNWRRTRGMVYERQLSPTLCAIVYPIPGRALWGAQVWIGNVNRAVGYAKLRRKFSAARDWATEKMEAVNA